MYSVASVVGTAPSKHAELTTDWGWVLGSDEFRRMVLDWLVVGGVIAIAVALLAWIFWPQRKVSRFPVLPADPASPPPPSSPARHE